LYEFLCLMELQFSLGDPSKGSGQILRNGSVYLIKFPCANGSSCTFYETVLPKGCFLLELWGAQGGNTNAGGVGGKGGYSRGILNLTIGTRAFIHIGGQPANTPGNSGGYVKIYGGFNGGGGSNSNSNCNSGGGGTDIRLKENTFYNRVIVAGGGGGGESYFSGYARYPAGAGGGVEGQASVYGPSTNGGKQQKGGEGGYGTQGSFGLGGNHGSCSAGGGGGWFGGSGSSNGGDNTGGGGGSGYVFNSNSYKPEGFKLTSELYLTEGTTIQGTQQFLSPEGFPEIGHAGHGAVRITVLGVSHKKLITQAKCFINIFSPTNSLILILLNVK
jgi:hypothetical protein